MQTLHQPLSLFCLSVVVVCKQWEGFSLPCWLLEYGSKLDGLVHSWTLMPISRDRVWTVAVFPQPDGPASIKIPAYKHQQIPKHRASNPHTSIHKQLIFLTTRKQQHPSRYLWCICVGSHPVLYFFYFLLMDSQFSLHKHAACITTELHFLTDHPGLLWISHVLEVPHSSARWTRYLVTWVGKYVHLSLLRLIKICFPFILNGWSTDIQSWST